MEPGGEGVRGGEQSRDRLRSANPETAPRPHLSCTVSGAPSLRFDAFGPSVVAIVPGHWAALFSFPGKPKCLGLMALRAALAHPTGQSVTAQLPKHPLGQL